MVGGASQQHSDREQGGFASNEEKFDESARRPYGHSARLILAALGAMYLVGVVLVAIACSNYVAQDSELPVSLSSDFEIHTTILHDDDDGINGDINRQAKKLIQRAAQEKAHAAQEKKKGADLVTKAQRTCEIAEVRSFAAIYTQFEKNCVPIAYNFSPNTLS
jgi:hypothetical protein